MGKRSMREDCRGMDWLADKHESTSSAINSNNTTPNVRLILSLSNLYI